METIYPIETLNDIHKAYTYYIGELEHTSTAFIKLLDIMMYQLSNIKSTVIFYPLNHFYVFGWNLPDTFVEGVLGMNTKVPDTEEEARSKHFYVFLNKQYLDLNDYPKAGPEFDKTSKFHMLTHELSHSAGATDKLLGEYIYGTSQCNTRANKHDLPSKLFSPLDDNIVADCFTYFIDYLYLIDKAIKATDINTIEA